MNKNDLLKSCRYYKGESDIPSSLDGLEVGYWLAESVAVDAVEEGRTGRFVGAWLEAGEPGKDSNLPPVLLSTLFFNFRKGSNNSPAETIKAFVDVYLPRYIASTSM